MAPTPTMGGVLANASGCGNGTPSEERQGVLRSSGTRYVSGHLALTGRRGSNLGSLRVEARLSDVTVLLGSSSKPVPDLVWIDPAMSDDGQLSTGADTGSTWGPGGAFVGLLSDEPVPNTGSDLGSLDPTGLVHDGKDVVLSSGGCWGVNAADAEPFDGKGLQEAPGSSSIERARKRSGFKTIPLDELLHG